jgi:patatin-like phospholipase/acyl hydrolase
MHFGRKHETAPSDPFSDDAAANTFTPQAASEHGEVQKPVSGHAFNLLSLDGGGIKGVSSLIILQRIMNFVRDIENAARRDQRKPEDHRERKPVDYFDLCGGTSTGGLIAIMLFRLEMSCGEALAANETMSRIIFSPKLGSIDLDELGPVGRFFGRIWLDMKALTGRSQFSYKPLETAIDTVVSQYPLDDDDRTQLGDAALIKASQGQM